MNKHLQAAISVLDNLSWPFEPSLQNDQFQQYLCGPSLIKDLCAIPRTAPDINNVSRVLNLYSRHKIN